MEGIPQFKKDDPKLGQIITEGLDGNVIIIGFPFDEGVMRNGGRRGAELGPDCLRRFIPKIGPLVNAELNISLENLTISDYGNIDLEALEEAHEKLKNKVYIGLKKPQQVMSFVIGGGNDQSWPNTQAFISYCSENSYKPVVINIDAHLDVRQLDDHNRVHSGCPFRLVLEDPIFQSLEGKFTEFACQGSQCAKAHVEFVEEKQGRLVWIGQIRRRPLNPTSNIKEPMTQAGQAFKELLDSFDESHRVFVSFDVDSIDSAYCPGVSCPSVDGGLTSKEAVEIGFLSGLSDKVVLMDMSEYNPAAEDQRTGRLLANIFYYMCLGVSARMSNKLC